MVDSQIVLNGQTIAYTCYAIVIILVVGWFGYQVTKPVKSNKISSTLFYIFVAFLVVLGVSLHIVTFNTIPWVEMDVSRSDYSPDKTFVITIEKHQFNLPADKLVIIENDMVMFDVTSHDLTYGFGIFRQDNSMVFQMQVVPGHRNDILWKFDKPGIYTIRSTEYSGPKGAQMILKDVVEVVAN
jgi:cytochrome c oxidase subunit 2